MTKEWEKSVHVRLTPEMVEAGLTDAKSVRDAALKWGIARDMIAKLIGSIGCGAEYCWSCDRYNEKQVNGIPKGCYHASYWKQYTKAVEMLK